jgi:hypothetical protein
MRLTTSPPSVSRLSRQNVGASTSHDPMGLHGLLTGTALPVYPVTSCLLVPICLLSNKFIPCSLGVARNLGVGNDYMESNRNRTPS